MMAGSHVIFNHFVYVGGSLIFSHTMVPGEMIAITLTATVADIDTPRSIVGKAIPNVSLWLDKQYGHRTITHSIWSVLFLGVLLFPLFMIYDIKIYFAAVTGHFLHIVADSFTKNGPMFLYPKVRGRFVSFTSNMRFATGSAHEKIVATLMFCFLLAMYPLHYKGFLTAFESIAGNAKQEAVVLEATEKVKYSQSMKELQNLLKAGTIDQKEFNEMAEARGLLNATLGITEGQTKSEKKKAIQGKCFAFVQHVDQRYLYLQTSPSCIDVQRNDQGFFPVRWMDQSSVPPEAQELVGQDVSITCVTANCTFYQNGSQLNY